MPTRGRPPMTQEALQQRIQAYCKRYKVQNRKPTGLPPYPAGERETRQHRDWIVLYKAVQRFKRRQAAAPASPERAAVLQAQDGRCPICLAVVGGDGQVARQPQHGATTTIVHPDCNELLGQVLRLGPSVLDRLRSYAWPPAPGSAKADKTR